MLRGDSRVELVRKATAGDRVALKSLLVEAHQSLCERLASRVPATLRRTVAVEDIVQETHIEVFRRIHAFLPREANSFDRWVFAIALSRLRNAVKRERALRRGGGRVACTASAEQIEESTLALLDTIVGPSHTPSRSAARAELVRAVQQALTELPEQYRQALWLVHIEGHPVKVAAENMGRTERAVHGLCRRGIALLRVRLKSASRFLSSDQ
ncbi:MAG: sigma-70 family RNA polymerase sigma factor [Planctomycetota bacterium]